MSVEVGVRGAEINELGEVNEAGEGGVVGAVVEVREVNEAESQRCQSVSIPSLRRGESLIISSLPLTLRMLLCRRISAVIRRSSQR